MLSQRRATSELGTTANLAWASLLMRWPGLSIASDCGALNRYSPPSADWGSASKDLDAECACVCVCPGCVPKCAPRVRATSACPEVQVEGVPPMCSRSEALPLSDATHMCPIVVVAPDAHARSGRHGRSEPCTRGRRSCGRSWRPSGLRRAAGRRAPSPGRRTACPACPWSRHLASPEPGRSLLCDDVRRGAART